MNSFSYPMQIVNGSAAPVNLNVPLASSLGSGNVGDIVILTIAQPRYDVGLYLKNTRGWTTLLDEDDLSAAAIYGAHLTIYVNPTSTISVPTGTTLYKNGNKQADGTSITAGNNVWVTSLIAASSGGGGGGGGEVLADAIFDNNFLLPKAGQSYVIQAFASFVFSMPACDLIVNGTAVSMPAADITMPSSLGEATWYLDIDSGGAVHIVSDKTAPAGTFPQQANTFRLIQVNAQDTNGNGYGIFQPINPQGPGNARFKTGSVSLNDLDSNGKMRELLSIFATILAGDLSTGDATPFLTLNMPNRGQPLVNLLSYMGDYPAANLVGKLTLNAQFVAQALAMGATFTQSVGEGQTANINPKQACVDMRAGGAGCKVDLAMLTASDSPILSISGKSSSFAFDVVNSGTYIGTINPGEGALVFGHGNDQYVMLKAPALNTIAIPVQQGDPNNGFTGNAFFVDRTLGNNFVLNIDRSPATIQYIDSVAPVAGNTLHFTAQVTEAFVSGGGGQASIAWNYTTDRFYFSSTLDTTVVPTLNVSQNKPGTWTAEYQGLSITDGPGYKVNYRYSDNPPVTLVAGPSTLTVPGATIHPDAYMNITRTDGGRVYGSGRLKCTITDPTVTGVFGMAGFLPATVPMDFRSQPTVNAMNALNLRGALFGGGITGTGSFPGGTQYIMFGHDSSNKDIVTFALDNGQSWGYQILMSDISPVIGDVVDLQFSFDGIIQGALMT